MRKIVYSLSLLAALSLASCSNILEQSPTDRYTDDQVWKDEYLINSHLAELYHMAAFMVGDAVSVYGNSPVNVNFSSSSDWSYNLAVSAEGEGPIHAITIADETKYSARGAQGHYRDIKHNGFQTNSTTLRWWDNGYYLNRQLNHFIENIEGSPVGNATMLKSEARFLRAFNFFAMMKRYGGIPLIINETAIDAGDEEMYPARSTEQECYDFIIDELSAIAEFLPASPERGKVGKAAALTLLSRAALYAGSIQQFGTVALNGLNGIPQGGAKNYYQIAADAAGKVMKMGNYSLYYGTSSDKVQNLRDIFLVKGNPEAIMVKAHEGNPESNYRWSWDMCNCPKPNAWSVGQYALPYYDFIEEFEYRDGRSGKLSQDELESHSWSMEEFLGERDPRLLAWVWTNGSSWPGAIGEPVLQQDGSVSYTKNQVSMYNGIRLASGEIFKNVSTPSYEGVSCWGDQMNEFAREESLRHTGFGVRKYLDEGANNSSWFIYSTTDYQIFRYAEVLLNYAEACFELGKTAEALSAINQIRSRAGIAPLSSLTREAVHHERKVELCFENHRYWDLRRWREAEKELNVYHQGIRYILDWDSYKAGQARYWMTVVPADDGVYRQTFPANNYYMPIGNGTVAKNPNIVENPGY